MLTYLVKMTEGLIPAAILLGSYLAYAKTAFSVKGKIITVIGIPAGLVISIVIAILNNTTNRIDTASWNMKSYIISLAASIVFLVIFLAAGNKKEAKNSGKVLWFALAIMICAELMYVLPTAWGYPYSFLSGEQTILSTDFLYKLIGYLLGFVLIFLIGLAVYHVTKRIGKTQRNLLLLIALIIHIIRFALAMIQVLLAKRIIVNNHFLFNLSKIWTNHRELFTYALIIVAILAALILIGDSMRQKEPYNNPAQHRKIRAKWRMARRWSCTSVITVVLGILVLTAVSAYENREVELSPVEDTVVKDNAVYVPFEMVEDGHLHRFAYVTDEGTQIRFIVIKKPNSSSYGIGLDACDICGETGYYEKDGQVVCKLCDVVMNINTIGFKGGCNPIVIDYRIENGNIIVPVEGLLEYESEFK